MSEISTYHFILVLSNTAREKENLEDILYEAGCDDALIFHKNNIIYLEFDRESKSLEDALLTAKHGLKLPLPLLAIENSKLLGGVAFTWYVKPAASELGFWINALLVALKSRGLGIASRLIRSAEIDQGLEELYVYTDIPILYEKLDWQRAEQMGEHYVLKKALLGK